MVELVTNRQLKMAYTEFLAMRTRLNGRPILPGARGVDIKTGSGSYIKIYGPPPRALVALPASLKSVLSKKAARCK